MSAADAVITSQVDHLVVAAATLDEAVAWCEQTLGINPAPGGEHPLMGTHNRLLSIASPQFPDAYLELLATNSGAVCARPAGLKRWFDLDDGEMQNQLTQNGPRLIHFVARTALATAAVRALHGVGLDRGEVLEASRPTAHGLLSWKISVRGDGQRLLYGALPTLIEWGSVHPAHSLPGSGILLRTLRASHPCPDTLRRAWAAVGLQGVGLQSGAPNLCAVLDGPCGSVTIESQGV